MEIFLGFTVFNTLINLMLFQPAHSEEQKKMLKAISSGDLGKVDSLRKNSQDGRFVFQPSFASIQSFFFFLFFLMCGSVITCKSKPFTVLS